MDPVPFPVFEAAVRVAGEALHWKRSLRQILRDCGVSENGYARYQHLSKFQILRSIWDDLDKVGSRGRQVHHKIITALANLDAPDPNAPDPVSGTQAIAELRRLATGAGLLVAPDELEGQARRVAAATARADTDSRRQRLAELHAEFLRLHGQENRQARGYAFENLLTDLFHLEELEYNGSYKTELDQVDGALNFKAFTYLIEARWRQAPAVEADLVLLKGKVDRRVFATRGLFISMAGFRPEVVQFYRLAHENKLILMDGQDLAWILDGRIDLEDALAEKVAAASIHGEPYLQLSTL